MWSNYINQTGLTTPAAEWYFAGHPTANVYDERGNSDSSLISTMRFLLHGKTGDGVVKVGGYNNGSRLTSGNRLSRYIRRQYDDNMVSNSLILFVEVPIVANEMKADLEEAYGFPVNNDSPNLLSKDAVITNEVTLCSELINLKLEYKPALTYFFGAKFGVYAFMDVENRVTVVFTSSLNAQKYHWLQAVLPMLMPWYWANKNGSIELEPECLALLETLNSTDHDKYLEIIDSFAEKLGFEKLYSDSMLKGFLASAQKKAIALAKREVDDLRRRINDYLDSIGTLTRQVDEKLAYVTGMELASDDAKADEFASYLQSNGAVKTIEFNGAVMDILCYGEMTYYDTDPLQNLLENKRSYVYDYADGTKLKNTIEKLLKAIFIDEKLRLRTCAKYRIDSANNRISPVSGTTYPAEFNDYLPNPHIDHYACIGDFAPTMAEYVASGNYIGAVDQCITSAQTLNFYDSVVTGRFVQDLANYYDTRKCIVLPDGSFTTIEKALEYLDGQAQG